MDKTIQNNKISYENFTSIFQNVFLIYHNMTISDLEKHEMDLRKQSINKDLGLLNSDLEDICETALYDIEKKVSYLYPAIIRSKFTDMHQFKEYYLPEKKTKFLLFFNTLMPDWENLDKELYLMDIVNYYWDHLPD